MSEEKVAVYVSKEVYSLIKRRVEQSGKEFTGVDDYVDFVLKEVVKKEEKNQKPGKKNKAEIEEKLRKLGYL